MQVSRISETLVPALMDHVLEFEELNAMRKSPLVIDAQALVGNATATRLYRRSTREMWRMAGCYCRLSLLLIHKPCFLLRNGGRFDIFTVLFRRGCRAPGMATSGPIL